MSAIPHRWNRISNSLTALMAHTCLPFVCQNRIIDHTGIKRQEVAISAFQNVQMAKKNVK